MCHAEATLEFLQRPGFPVQLPAGQDLRSLKGPGSLTPVVKGTRPPALPWVPEIGAHCNPAKEFVQVSLYLGCIHFLVFFGCSSLVWFCVTDGNCSTLGLPLVPPPTG